MKLGLFAFATDLMPPPAELAAQAEGRGYDSLWVPDHTHIPSSRETPWVDGRDLPAEYARILDPFCVLTEAATATTSLLLGVGVCLVVQRDPIVLAKQVATVDHLSRGRFLLGVGYGWNVEEMRNHGIDFRQRHAVTAEKIGAMKALWTEEEASFSGEHVRFEPSWAWPKPVQQPHPPVLIGGKGPRALRQVAELADGWLPAGGFSGDRLALLETELERCGRTLADITVTVFGPKPEAPVLDRYRELGVDRVVLQLHATTRDEAMRELDEYDALMTAFTG